MISLVLNNVTMLSDLVRNGGNIVTDDSLETAVLISLFTRGRARPGDVLPEPLGNRGGYWGDSYPDVPGDQMGSRLWLLSRSIASQEVVNQAQVYSQEALDWMVVDGVARSVVAETERRAEDVLAFKVSIEKPTDVASRWQGAWTAHLSEL